MQTGDSPRILVIQVKRIGDLVLSAPLMASLKEQVPGAKVTVVARGVAGKLAPLLPGVDKVLVLREGKANLGVWWALARSRFDVAFDLSANDRSRLATFLSRARTRATFDKWRGPGLRGRIYNRALPGGIGDRPITEFFLSLLTMINLEARRVPCALELPEKRGAIETRISEWKRGGRRLAIIHPGTTEEAKYWSAEAWARTIDHLKREHRATVVISRGNDPFEIAHIDRIKSHADTAIDHDELLPLPELVVALHHCDIAMGVDTGSMHIAALAEKAQVVLYNSKNWIQWRPRHPKARPLRPAEGGDVASIEVGKVIAAADELLQGAGGRLLTKS